MKSGTRFLEDPRRVCEEPGPCALASAAPVKHARPFVFATGCCALLREGCSAALRDDHHPKESLRTRSLAGTGSVCIGSGHVLRRARSDASKAPAANEGEIRLTHLRVRIQSDLASE